MSVEDKASFSSQATQRADRNAIERGLALDAEKLLSASPEPKEIFVAEGTEGIWVGSNILGEGTYGKVYAVTEKHTGINLAAKIGKRTSMDNMEHERQCLSKFASPHVIQMFGFVAVSDDRIALLLEIAECDLQAWLSQNPLPSLPALAPRWQLTLQMAAGLCHVHSRDVVHCDVKTENALIFQNGKLLKISDFGCSMALQVGKAIVVGNLTYTSLFRPPELIVAGSNKTFASPATDVFAFGCVCFDLFRSRHSSLYLFPDKKLMMRMAHAAQSRGLPAALAAMVQARDHRLQLRVTCGARAIDLVKAAVTAPERRISLQSIVTRCRTNLDDSCLEQRRPPALL
jgi:serine/threonine protein kinase